VERRAQAKPMRSTKKGAEKCCTPSANVAIKKRDNEPNIPIKKLITARLNITWP